MLYLFFFLSLLLVFYFYTLVLFPYYLYPFYVERGGDSCFIFIFICNYMLNIYYIFSILQVFTASFLFFSNNPIHSILFLILLFFESTVILSFLNLEFVSLLFILVYVGAIAVLFLFVIMMLRVKLDEFDVLLFLPVNFALNSYLMIYIFSYIQPFTYMPGIFLFFRFYLF